MGALDAFPQRRLEDAAVSLSSHVSRSSERSHLPQAQSPSCHRKAAPCCLLHMPPIVLRTNPSPDDTEWVFTARLGPPPKRPGMGMHVAFTADSIKLDWTLFPGNRILQSDDMSKFVLVSFEGLRFPDKPPSTNRDYKIRFFKEGLRLNGVEYRFYGHSNSQLVRGSSTTLHCC